MLKILVLTQNHPIEACEVMQQLYDAIAQIDNRVFIGSPQFTALQVERVKNIPYLEGFYPAVKAYKKIEDFATDSPVDVIITVGTVDVADITQYQAIIGLRNSEIKDYTEFPEEFNTSNITLTTVDNSDIIFRNINEVIHFLRIIINNYRRKENEKDNEQVQHLTMEGDILSR